MPLRPFKSTKTLPRPSFATVCSVITLSGLMLSGISMGSTATAAPVDRFRGNSDTFHRIQDVLDTLFPEEAIVPGLSGMLGLGLGVTPDYLGASGHGQTVVPIVRLNYRNIVILSGTALYWNALSNDHWRIGLHGRYISGRGTRQSGILAGLEDVDSTLAFGPYVEYRLGHTKLAAEWRHAISGSRGDELRLTASTGIYQSKDQKYAVFGALGASIGSAKSLRTDFGITPEESSRSSIGLAPYSPGGGLSNVGLSFGGQYKLSENWNFGQFIELERLLGEADDSPLVKAGSPWQFSGGVGVYYRF